MTVTGSARFHRRNTAPPTKPKKPGNFYPVLISCCLFLAILCACLLAALVLIGKHLYHNRTDVLQDEDIIVLLPTSKKTLLARLPNDTAPIHYNLTLMPDLEKGDFKGKVNITLQTTRTRRNLFVHSKNLSIDQVNLFSANDSKAIDVLNVEEKEISEMLSVVPSDELAPGVYYLTFTFSGTMLDKLTGLYRSQYIIQNSNETRAMATSKFEPTYARQAFPCFDEPDMKAKYTVQIQTPKTNGYHALSNMPVVRTVDVDENSTMVHFEESVQMSTYLACFIVCDFDKLETVVRPSIGKFFPLKVYATPAQKTKTEFALEVADAVITYFVDYFGIEYPLPKLDLIAIPDFVSGAMEHWGLVTFRETALLYDNKISSTANKQRVATVISHELAHSWFGNLVTMKWWNDLWLNEGFASYIQYKGLQNKYADWQMLDQFLIEHLHSVLSLDATPASHPIVQTVITPDQITEIFDTITYNKGAAVLRMLENAVTPQIFQSGVTAYLNAHKYGNAVTQDLWDKLQEIVLEFNITTFMNTWTLQKGYPIITVKEENNKYILTQKRFLKNYEDVKDVTSPYEYKWTIPITYISDKQPRASQIHWFKHTDEILEIPMPAEDVKWIKFNPDQVGYYRVNYNLQHWEHLINNIKTMPSISDKTHLLEESFSIAESGDLDYKVPLGLTKYLVEEFNYIPWSVASTKLEKIRKYLVDSAQYSKFLEYVLLLVKPAYDELTWTVKDTDSHLTRRARVTILGLACSMGHASCLNDAATKFNEWLNDPSTDISPDLRSIIYNYGMVKNGNTEWEKLLELHKAELDANEKLNMMRGLAAVKEPWLLRRLIELGKIVGDEQVIRSQDYFTMLQYVAANPVGTSIVWDYVRENWEYLVDRFTLNDRYLGRLIPAITSSFLTKTKLEEVNAFFGTYPEAGAGQAAREEAVANIKNNIKWVADNREAVEKWISDTMIPTPHTLLK